MTVPECEYNMLSKKKYSPGVHLHRCSPNPNSFTHTEAICLCTLISLPVWRSTAGKVTDLQRLFLFLYTLSSYLLLSPFTFSCSFFFYQHSTFQYCISYVCLVCLSPSYFSSTSLHICHPAPLSQGDPAFQSPLSVKPGTLLILLHLSCLFPPLWVEFMTVP